VFVHTARILDCVTNLHLDLKPVSLLLVRPSDLGQPL
jgi:hypothetical protein